MVQFFSHCTPSGLEDSDVDLDYVAHVLDPVLGEVDANYCELETASEPLTVCREMQRSERTVA